MGLELGATGLGMGEWICPSHGGVLELPRQWGFGIGGPLSDGGMYASPSLVDVQVDP